jgi:DNA-binding transcriptional MerR regulator
MLTIPNKSNFKFQELTPITGVKPYVIRFWETEFPEISPVTSDSGQKLYARKDIEAILKVKKLLFEDKLSIPEAKAKMTSSEVEMSKIEAVAEIVQDEVESSQVDVTPVLLKALDLIKEIKFRRKW